MKSLTSPLASMAMGYFRSRALTAAARLGVADSLAETELTVEQLAVLCGADEASLYRLLRALASFGIVAETPPRSFVLTALGQPLRKDAPASEWASVVFWGDLLADNWSWLTECVRTGENAAVLAAREGATLRWAKDPGANAVFGAVMGHGTTADYLPLVNTLGGRGYFSGSGTVADLGGGGGGLLQTILEAFPHLRGMLVERPEFITPREEARCQYIAADLIHEVPQGARLYLMKHVLHGYVDETARTILERCRAVLPPEGKLLVIEFVAPDVVAHPDPHLEFRLMSDLNMLAVTHGRERNALEWKQLIASAGLHCERIFDAPGDLASIIEISVP